MSNAARDDFKAAASAVAAAVADARDTSDAPSTPVPVGVRGIAIVHTNDSHGHDARVGESMGMAAVAAVRDSLEREGYEVLVLDAGDALQGNTYANYFKGASIIHLMSAVGYDAMTLGNHDFDYGQDVLRERIAAAPFALLAANVLRADSAELAFEPNASFTLENGMRVGVFGLTTPETQTKTAKWLTEGLAFLEGQELYEAAQAQVDLLRAEGSDLVVMLAHLGDAEESYPNRASDVVAHVTGIDVVVDGHAHQEKQRTMADAGGRPVLLVAAGCFTHAIGVVTYEGGELSSRLLHPEDFAGEDPVVASVVASIKQRIDDELDQAFATTDYLLSGKRRPGVRDHETNLGDLLADSFLWAARSVGETDASCAIVSGGAIRAGIEAGEITMNSVLTVQPYANAVVTIRVPGSALLEALEAASQACPRELGGFAQVAGITYEIDTRVPFEAAGLYPASTYHAPAKPGSRVTIHTVGGEPFDEASTYTVATTDFNATGGDTYYAFSQYADTMLETGRLDNQALCDYLSEALGGTVSEDYANENGEGRITVIE